MHCGRMRRGGRTGCACPHSLPTPCCCAAIVNWCRLVSPCPGPGSPGTRHRGRARRAATPLRGHPAPPRNGVHAAAAQLGFPWQLAGHLHQQACMPSSTRWMRSAGPQWTMQGQDATHDAMTDHAAAAACLLRHLFTAGPGHVLPDAHTIAPIAASPRCPAQAARWQPLGARRSLASSLRCSDAVRRRLAGAGMGSALPQQSSQPG